MRSLLPFGAVMRPRCSPASRGGSGAGSGDRGDAGGPEDKGVLEPPRLCPRGLSQSAFTRQEEARAPSVLKRARLLSLIALSLPSPNFSLRRSRNVWPLPTHITVYKSIWRLQFPSPLYGPIALSPSPPPTAVFPFAILFQSFFSFSLFLTFANIFNSIFLQIASKSLQL